MAGGKSHVSVSDEALFRYRVVCEVLTKVTRGEARAHAVQHVAEHALTAVDGRARKVSTRTVYRWLAAFERGGLLALEPAGRRRVETSAALTDALVTFLREEKTSDPRASVPELLERARQLGVLQSREFVARSTAWRAIKRMGLPTRRRPSKREGDTRRFAHPNRMNMVLCDGKHFRAGIERRRRVVLYFLDDSTRFGLRAVVGTSEHTELFLRGVFEVAMRFGLMDALFLDHGPGFISNDTLRVVGQLGRAIVHGTVAYPQGHGKVERFNQSALADVLRGFDGAADVDPDPRSLELRLNHHLERYNDRPHESLAQQTPRSRFLADSRELCFPTDEQALRAKFVVTEERRVSNDHIIQYEGKSYEAPRGLAREKVLVHRQILTGELSVLHDQRLVTLHEVDLAQNARDRRGKPTEPVEEQAPVKTAATLAYERDFAPVVQQDGGFTATTNNNKNN